MRSDAAKPPSVGLRCASGRPNPLRADVPFASTLGGVEKTGRGVGGASVLNVLNRGGAASGLRSDAAKPPSVGLRCASGRPNPLRADVPLAATLGGVEEKGAVVLVGEAVRRC